MDVSENKSATRHRLKPGTSKLQTQIFVLTYVGRTVRRETVSSRAPKLFWESFEFL